VHIVNPFFEEHKHEAFEVSLDNLFDKGPPPDFMALANKGGIE
jgi:hypothetical protein